MASKKAARKRPKQLSLAFDVNDFLRSWATVQAVIGNLTPEQLLSALEAEKAGKNRPSIVARLATRYDNLTKHERIKELV